MLRTNSLLLALLTGLLLALSWPHYGFAPLAFIAWIPLLIAEQRISHDEKKRKGLRIFALSYFAFFIWNAITTWWIWNATPGGAVMAILANSLIMALVFLFYHRTKKRLGAKWNWAIFICYWLMFEWVHMHWDLSWTWLTLGNVFAKNYDWVQWYEYTGVFGGSLWVLALNFFILNSYNCPGKRKLRNLIAVLSLLLLPVAVSKTISLLYIPDSNNAYADVVVVQPNIDPYNEKFSGDYATQLKKMLELARQKLDSNTDYLVFPETALQEGIWENDLDETYSIPKIKEFLQKYPKLKIITGASSAKSYETAVPPTLTARKFKNDFGYYDNFNTAFQVDNSGNVQTYHKSILVPGVEKMPYPLLFGWLEDYAIELGGTSGSLAGQEERTVFVSPDGRMKVAPIICYESVYGEYVTDYVNKGAQILFIITNDGWWGNSSGYHQHMMYASLRAIETRRCIARSANTGISCFIDEEGNISDQTEWWKTGVIKQSLMVHNENTFYVSHGDYIARVAVFFSIVCALAGFYKQFWR